MNKLNAALEYAQRGWKVFPLSPNSKIPLKNSSGVKDATDNLDAIRAWWTTNPDANIALACGEASGIYVIDIDVGHKNGIDGFQMLIDKKIELPSTLWQKTPSGGAHLLYKWTTGEMPPNKVNVLPGIDLRCNGAYIVLAPSTIDGKTYEWQTNEEMNEFPEVIKPKKVIDPWQRIKASAEKNARIDAPTGDVYNRAKAYLAECSPAIQGAGGHAALLWAAQAMVQGFGLSESEAIALLWSDFNPRCMPQWEYDNVADRKDFERKVREAKLHPLNKPQNWLLEESRLADVKTLDPNLAEDFVQAILAKAKIVEEGEECEEVSDDAQKAFAEIQQQAANDELPRELTALPGIAGQIFDWINSSAGTPQPILALGATLVFCGALMGQKVRDESGGRTNIYGLGVGYSSAGKDYALKAVIKIIQSSGIEDMLGGEVSSDTAIERSLKNSPVKLFMMDEIGCFFKTINSSRGNAPHLSTIVPTFMKLFSAAQSLYVGKQRAGKDDNVIKIVEPCVCIWGTTTPKTFFDSMTEEELQGGWTARNLLFITRSRPKYRFPKAVDVPKNITDVVNAWWCRKIIGNPELEGNISAAIKPHQLVISTEELAMREFEQFRDECYEKMLKADKSGDVCNYLWGKSLENARRIALIYACSRDYDGAIIDRVAAEYGCKLVRFLTSRSIKEIHRAYAGNEYERMKKRIYDLIEKSRDEGMKHTALVARTAWVRDAKTRAGYIDELIEANRVKKVVVKGKTKNQIVYYATQWSPIEGEKSEFYEED